MLNTTTNKIEAELATMSTNITATMTCSNLELIEEFKQEMKVVFFL